jgi:hypothetical protein
MSSATPSIASIHESSVEQAESVDVEANLHGEKELSSAVSEQEVSNAPSDKVVSEDPSMNEVDIVVPDTEILQDSGAIKIARVLSEQEILNKPEITTIVKEKRGTIKRNRAPPNKVSVPVQVFQMQGPDVLDSAGDRQLKFKPKSDATYIEFPNLLDGFLLVSSSRYS